MGLSRKRKQHLAQITARAAESKKHRKIDEENRRRGRFLRKQREEEDFWADEHEDFGSESSSDKSNIDESRLGGYSSDEENLDERENVGDGTQEGWEITMGGYNQRHKNTLLCLFGKMMQVDVFEELGGVVHRPQKNVNDDVKEK